MEKMKVKIKKLSENAALPAYGSEFAAGADLYALAGEDIKIRPGETVMIHTGIAAQIPKGFGGFIFARSGLAAKRGLAPANKVGVVDSDYRGEIMVSLYNQSDAEQIVEGGERIAQLVIMPYAAAEFIACDELSDTARADGGFGSTGTK